eukprot:3962645-Pleurochrysis_carterae.AAC.1
MYQTHDTRDLEAASGGGVVSSRRHDTITVIFFPSALSRNNHAPMHLVEKYSLIKRDVPALLARYKNQPGNTVRYSKERLERRMRSARLSPFPLSAHNLRRTVAARAGTGKFVLLEKNKTAVSQRECNFELFLAKAKGVLEKVKQRGGANMRRNLLKAQQILSQITLCIILFKSQLHARRALSK